MVIFQRSLLVGVGACFLCAAAAFAQDTNSQSTSNTIGPPQLRYFSLEPKQTIVDQPDPATQPAPVRVIPPSPVTNPPPRATPNRQPPPAATSNRPAPTATTPPARQAPAPATTTAPVPAPDATLAPPPIQDASPTTPAPIPSEPAPAAPTAESAGPSYWLYALPVALLALLGIVALQRRRRRDEEEVVEAPAYAPVAAAPPQPRAEPVARPWIELDLKTERATFTATEANIQFQLEVRNTGKSPARNLRIDVKMFNAGAEQDKEIGAFFRTAGRDNAKLKLPGVGAETSGVIRGEVGLTLEEMRAVRLDDRMLFIPVVAVNVLYDCGDGRTGQSSKSYVVGRELQQSSEKMGAFRVDQGPRVWRTVGQRQHKLARRV